MVTTEETITQKENNIKSKVWQILFGAICSVAVVIAFLLFFSALWYEKYFANTGFDSVLYAIFSNTEGANLDILNSFYLEGVLPVIFFSFLILLLIFSGKIKKLWLKKIKYWHKMVFSLLLSAVLIIVAGAKVNVFGYIQKIMLQTTLYEDYYVEPNGEVIKFPNEKRNLIFLFLESMETTYMSETDGGALKVNVVPNLTRLAEENINFSQNDSVGGFLTPSGTSWTVAAMVSQTSGVPLKASSGFLENNIYGKESFLPGIVSLSDILNENGYYQALCIGSDASYANRDVYFKQHKTDDIFDYSEAKKEGIIEEDYHAWWGMEDKYVFEYAKNKLLEMEKRDEPFALTVLTADTHFPDGYICELCDDEFCEQYHNVISCADRQVGDFISWIEKQSFYENTTIVICGDHMTMDNQYASRNIPKDYERHIYNCFINSAQKMKNSKNRIFTSVDIFPTVLSALGCEIRGERLGLGTNLFSGKQTLAEELGYDVLDRKLIYSSNFYIKNFMIDEKK